MPSDNDHTGNVRLYILRELKEGITNGDLRADIVILPSAVVPRCACLMLDLPVSKYMRVQGDLVTCLHINVPPTDRGAILQAGKLNGKSSHHRKDEAKNAMPCHASLTSPHRKKQPSPSGYFLLSNSLGSGRVRSVSVTRRKV